MIRANKLLTKILVLGSCLLLSACNSNVKANENSQTLLQNEFEGRLSKQKRSLDLSYEEYKTNASLSFKYVKNGETNYTYSNVNLRFGFTIDKDKLDSDASDWSAYGVLLVSEQYVPYNSFSLYLQAKNIRYDYSYTTDSNLDSMHVNHQSFVRKRYGVLDLPQVVDELGNVDPNGSFYRFDAYLPVDASHYNKKVFAVAFVAMNGTLKFLQEACESVSTLAFKHYREDANSLNDYPLFDFASRDEDTTVIPWGTTEIADSAYKSQYSLKKVLIPSTVKRIGNFAFQNTNLDDVAFGIGVEEIGRYAFTSYSTKINKYVLPDSLVTLGERALGNLKCETLYIGKGLHNINYSDSSLNYSGQVDYLVVDEDNAYYDSRNDCNCLIETATNKIIGGSANSRIDDSVTAIGSLALADVKFINTELVIPDSVTSLDRGCFAYTNVTKITVPGTITYNYGDTFHDCWDLEYAYICDGIETIPYNFFEYCEKLKYVRLPSTLKCIDSYAFYRCDLLETIYIPSKVEQIKSSAFSQCGSLTNIYLPSSLTSVNISSAFSFINSGAVYYIENETTPTSYSTSGYNIVLNAKRAILSSNGNTIPASKTDIFTAEIDESMTSIQSYAFSGATNLKYVSFSNTVTIINNYAFNSCSSLSSVVLSDKLRTIYNYGFSKTGLTEIVLPNSVTYLAPSAFRESTSLASVKLSRSLTNISKNCFRGCSSLVSIVIPISVTTTGEDLFRSCLAMTNIYCEASEKPSGWSINWANECPATITWGYQQ